MNGKLIDPNIVETFTFDWELVAPNTIRLNYTLHNLQRIVNRMDTHIVLYRNYHGKWTQFLFDVWENLCDVLDRKKMTPILDLIYRNLKQYTNARHPCPYGINETIWIITEKYDVKNFQLPLLPPGQYRVDVNSSFERKRKAVIAFQFFFDMSYYQV